MLGRDHALSGAAAMAVLAPSLHLSGPHLAAAVTLGAGAAVLPDIDHPDSTVSRTFGFLTEVFAWTVARVSGGHRHGTHSLAGVAFFTAAAIAAGWYQLHGGRAHPGLSWALLPAAVFLALLYSAALRALRIGGHFADLLGLAAAAATCLTGADLAQVSAARLPLLGAAAALGCTVHIAGDCLTHGGCPLLWPVNVRDFHLMPGPLQFTTGRIAERWVVSPLLLAVLAVAIMHDTGGTVSLLHSALHGQLPR